MKTPAPVPALSLVIAVKEGAEFIDEHVDRTLRFLATRGEPTELVVVDDGSRDDTCAILRRRARVHGARPGSVTMRLLCHEVNAGKGAAIRAGMLAARGRQRVFLDADLAFPLHEVETIRTALAQGADVAYASRALPGSVVIVESGLILRRAVRRVVGRLFVLLVRLVLCPRVRDSQAGLKGFTAEAAIALFGRQRITRFAFDAELLFLAHRSGLRTTAVPVEIHDLLDATTLRLVRDGAAMLRDVLRVRVWAWCGVYERAAPRVRARVREVEVTLTGLESRRRESAAPTLERGSRA